MTIFTSSTYLPVSTRRSVADGVSVSWRARIRRLFEIWGAAYVNGTTRPN